MERMLIACTGCSDGGLVGPDRPWTPLAATPGLRELWEADPELLGEDLQRHARPRSGGLWVADGEVSDGRVLAVSWRYPSEWEVGAYLAGQVAAGLGWTGLPAAPVIADYQWLVRGRL